MSANHLSTYLNDHLAGSEGAVQLLEYLKSAYAGTEVATFAVELRDEVLADVEALERLMAQCHIRQSATRKASAWIAEKFLQLKLRADDWSGTSLRLLEATDALSIGVEGKRLLWHALAAARESTPEFASLDYERLIRRAEDQRARIEIVRLTAASKCLTTGPADR